MNWAAEFFAQGGTGYTNPGQAEQKESAFPGRVKAVVAAKPDYVIVQGGINDGSPELTKAAADEVFSTLRAGLPRAKVIAIGPVAAPKASAAKLAPIRDALAASAEEHGVTFIDPIEERWLPNAALFSDGLHPTQEGHAQVAQNIVEDLGAAGIKPA
jgi:lysophospholipase L1-like esterase